MDFDSTRHSSIVFVVHQTNHRQQRSTNHWKSQWQQTLGLDCFPQFTKRSSHTHPPIWYRCSHDETKITPRTGLRPVWDFWHKENWCLTDAKKAQIVLESLFERIQHPYQRVNNAAISDLEESLYQWLRLDWNGQSKFRLGFTLHWSYADASILLRPAMAKL